MPSRSRVEENPLVLWTNGGWHRYIQVLSAWQFTPEIVLGLLLLACLYVNGMRRRSQTRKRHGRWSWRPWSYFTGLVSLYLALQSPLDYLADRLFCVHQIQHLILMMIGPIFLLAPGPSAALTAGMPRGVRPLLLAPIARSRAIRAAFAFLTHPFVATILCGGMLYFWMIPSMYDAALANERIHDLMHFGMLAGGLLFWWRVLDWRRPPLGTSYLARAVMLKVNLMMVAFLGAFLTAKQYAIYSGSGRFDLVRVSAITDERLGGMVLWFGGCGILVIALTIKIRRWILQLQASDAAWVEAGEDGRKDTEEDSPSSSLDKSRQPLSATSRVAQPITQ